MQVLFSLTATQLDGIDAAEVTGATLSANSYAVRVPRHLIVTKAAGDAYTVGGGAKVLVRDDDDNILFCFPAEGFLDQATAQGRYVEAATSGKAFKSGGSSTFTVDALGSVAKGTDSPSVKFTIVYDEYKVLD